MRLKDDEFLIVAHNRAHTAYYHWLTQCVPAIDWSLRTESHRGARLLLPQLLPWQEEMLVLLGYGNVPRHTVQQNQQYLLPQAGYSEFLNGRTSFGICTSALETCRRLIRPGLSNSPPRLIVYVHAAEFYYGRLVNSEEVVRFLERRGVQIVTRENTTTKDRIQLFQNADVVIGPHHDGLTDVLFCKPEALLWELMPEYMHNSCYNRLAQATRLDYWGDQFESERVGNTRTWRVDLDVLADRWRAISTRLAIGSARPGKLSLRTDELGEERIVKPLDELMMQFENLGDNCEFGLVQRSVGIEPLGLLRFAGFHLPIEQRLQKLVSALDADFAGLGSLGSIIVELQGVAGRREFIARETVYNLTYHTFMIEGTIDPETLCEREARRLTFLRRKLVDDLRVGEKIWVWKSKATTALVDVTPLLNALRRHGPNVLLWIVEANSTHDPGTVERIEDDLFLGYVERFAPYENATDVSPLTWLQVCQATYNICNPVAVTRMEVEGNPGAVAESLTAMQILSHSPRPMAVAKTPTPSPSLFRRLIRWWSNRISRR